MFSWPLQIYPVTGRPTAPSSDWVVTPHFLTSLAQHSARPIVNTVIALSCLTSSPPLHLLLLLLLPVSGFSVCIFCLSRVEPHHVLVISVTTDLSSCRTTQRIKIQFAVFLYNSARAHFSANIVLGLNLKISNDSLLTTHNYFH